MSYWQAVPGQIRLGEFNCLCSAYARSDRVGVGIIIYFYVFNLTACGLKTTRSHDCVADLQVCTGLNTLAAMSENWKSVLRP